jgi:uncharacterized small protein (DUF1192 family)
VIRRTVGYGRYDSDQEVEILNKLYGYLRCYVNFFQPVRKLVQKERIGSRIIKKYDVAQTPYRRVLACPDISEEIKMKLQRQYDMLNPAELKRQITRLQNELLRLNALKHKISRKAQSSFEYIST